MPATFLINAILSQKYYCYICTICHLLASFASGLIENVTTRTLAHCMHVHKNTVAIASQAHKHRDVQKAPESKRQREYTRKSQSTHCKWMLDRIVVNESEAAREQQSHCQVQFHFNFRLDTDGNSHTTTAIVAITAVAVTINHNS